MSKKRNFAAVEAFDIRKATAENNTPSTMDETVVFEFHVSGGSNMRKMDPRALGERNGQDFGTMTTESGEVLSTAPDWASFGATKCIIHRRYIRKIIALDDTYRAWINNKSLPGLTKMLAGGLRMVPLALIDLIETRTEEYLKEREALVNEEIRAKYEEIKEDAAKRLAEHFVASEFPSREELCASFQVERRYLSFNAPQQIAKMNSEIFAREQERVRKEWETTLVTVRGALREGFQSLIGRLNERLAVDSDGKPKRFTQATLDAFNEFLSTFEARDMSKDSDLKELVERAKGLLSGVSTGDVRENDSLRNNLQTEFKMVGDAIKQLTVQSSGGGRRRFGAGV
jgi:hypothetical protein